MSLFPLFLENGGLEMFSWPLAALGWYTDPEEMSILAAPKRIVL